MVDLRSLLASLAFLWIMLAQGISAGAQAAIQPSDIAGAYDCSASGNAPKQKLVMFPSGRWIKGVLFDPAAFKIRWSSVQIRSYHTKMVFLERDPKLRGQFRVQKDRLLLYSLQPGVLHNGFHSGPESPFEPSVPDASLVFEQHFRIDRASHALIEILPSNAIRAPLTCTKDGLF